MELTDIIKKHISYTASDNVAEICKPLFNSLNINLFAHSKYYPDGSCLHLTTCQDAFYHHLNSKYPFCGTMITPGIHLWENFLPSVVLKDHVNLFNLHNGITICNQNKKCLEIFNFATSTHKHAAIDSYFNNLNLLNQFIFYFKDKAENLIEQAYKARFIIPDAMRCTVIKDRYYDEFLKLIQTDKIHLNLGKKDVVLSRREYECLTQLARGRTMKETARILNISPRTVEDHLTNAKNKTNCIFRSQLIDLFYDNIITF